MKAGRDASAVAFSEVINDLGRTRPHFSRITIGFPPTPYYGGYSREAINSYRDPKIQRSQTEMRLLQSLAVKIPPDEPLEELRDSWRDSWPGQLR